MNALTPDQIEPIRRTALDHILSYAFEQRASDIHFEPKRDQGGREIELRVSTSTGIIRVTGQ